MKEKIKLGIPIENETTGEINVILRINEIRIVEEAFEEIERLNNIIDKAIDYMDRRDLEWGSDEHNKLVNILKGSDKE